VRSAPSGTDSTAGISSPSKASSTVVELEISGVFFSSMAW
jgi:hypothetical protein